MKVYYAQQDECDQEVPQSQVLSVTIQVVVSKAFWDIWDFYSCKRVPKMLFLIYSMLTAVDSFIVSPTSEQWQSGRFYVNPKYRCTLADLSYTIGDFSALGKIITIIQIYVQHLRIPAFGKLVNWKTS